jgi:hypothetical protein
VIRREPVIRGVWRGGDSGSRRLPVEEGKGLAERGNRVIEISCERQEISSGSATAVARVLVRRKIGSHAP